jgi:hypothetical protein
MKQPLAPNTAIAHYRLHAPLGAEVKYATPEVLFALSDIGANEGAIYTRTSDGQRFLLKTSPEETSVMPFTVV